MIKRLLRKGVVVNEQNLPVETFNDIDWSSGGLFFGLTDLMKFEVSLACSDGGGGIGSNADGNDGSCGDSCH